MIANAGIAQVKALLDLSEDDVRRMFEVNVFGVFNCYSAAAKQMIKQGGGGKLIGCARFVPPDDGSVEPKKLLMVKQLALLLSNHLLCSLTIPPRSLLFGGSHKHLRWRWPNTRSL